jgi:hypothetical protein
VVKDILGRYLGYRGYPYGVGYDEVCLHVHGLQPPIERPRNPTDEGRDGRTD